MYTTTYGCKLALVPLTPAAVIDVDVPTVMPVPTELVAVEALVTRHSPPFSIGPGAPKKVDCE
jgi:hypothetical protein